VIVTVPRNDPCPIGCLGTLYSASWSTNALLTTNLKNWLIWFARSEFGLVCHTCPQKIVNTFTESSSGPPR
jgi:hypothetical protein